MPDWMSADVALALRRRELNLAILLRIAVDTEDGEHVTGLWSGFGDFPVGQDSVETRADAIYSGQGEITGLPELSQLINGESDRIEFRRSGAGEAFADAAAMLDEISDDLDGAQVRVGIIVLGDDLQPVTPTAAWLWAGEVDVGQPEYDGMVDPPVSTIVLWAASQQATRNRGTLMHFTDAQQRLRSPDDDFCSRVSMFTAGYRLRWPVF